MNLENTVKKLCEEARQASKVLATVDSTAKNHSLELMAQYLVEDSDRILARNKEDLANARALGLSSAMIDRLALDKKRIGAMADGIKEVALLRDPVGEITRMWTRPNGLQVGQMRIPLGVIGIIYESRPNVTADAAALCIKAGNAVILRGGKEAINSNIAITEILKRAMDISGLPEDALKIVNVTDREAVEYMLRAEGYIDLIIPRGGASLIRFVADNSRIPVIKHYKGVCHIYVDLSADIAMAVNIVLNAKIQRPGVCNAVETLLVNEGIAQKFLPAMIKRLKEKGVEIMGCKKTIALAGDGDVKRAEEEDWYSEYLDLILAVKVVSNLDEAVYHIERYGSSHTESIITSDYKNALEFIRRVDSSCVFINASTRFSDGFQLGLGAEIGISTTKLHAFGPMGVEELTTKKFIAFGQGQLRE